MGVGQLSSNLPFDQMINKWAGQLNPVLANLLIQGLPWTGVVLVSGVPQTINHRLGRNQIGWIITDQNAAASIFRTQPFNAYSITLQSNANVTINLWNF